MLTTKPVSQIFTFCGHQPERNCFIEIFGKDKDDCRAKMFAKFGDKWGFQYDTKEDAGVEQFNLTQIK